VKDVRLKSEALIGIVYAFTSALTVLFISKSPQGDSDISEVLFGSLFTVTDSQIINMSIIFVALGAMHFFFRKKFFSLTESIQKNSSGPIKVFDLWNFLFYLSIGLAIVLAVQAGGVIPVFSYLIIPPVASILLTRNDSFLVIIALIVSITGTFLGIYFSIEFDFPAGSSIVTILGILFLLAALISFIKRKLSKARLMSS
jgi:ABC-type Mn2+/Zn2+ transport system permease subunit